MFIVFFHSPSGLRRVHFVTRLWFATPRQTPPTVPTMLPKYQCKKASTTKIDATTTSTSLSPPVWCGWVVRRPELGNSGCLGKIRTRTRNIGYLNCQVLFIFNKFQVLVFKIRNFENPKNPTRNFRVARTPSHIHRAQRTASPLSLSVFNGGLRASSRA